MLIPIRQVYDLHISNSTRLKTPQFIMIIKSSHLFIPIRVHLQVLYHTTHQQVLEQVILYITNFIIITNQSFHHDQKSYVRCNKGERMNGKEAFSPVELRTHVSIVPVQSFIHTVCNIK